MPGIPQLVLKAENEGDHEEWTIAMEKCKYEDLDEIMPEEYKTNRPGSEDVFQDPQYEMPVHVIEKIERMKQVIENSLPSYQLSYPLSYPSSYSLPHFLK